MLYGLIVTSILISVAYYFVVTNRLPNDAAAVDLRSQFGNMFGALNALFSAFAFSGLIYAILLQRDDLALQREDLAATREELAGQRRQLELQNEGIATNRFYDGLYRLVSLHADIVRNVRYVNQARAGGPVVGRQGLQELEAEIRRAGTTMYSEEPTTTASRGVHAFKDATTRDGADMMSYFQNFAELLRFVLDAPPRDREAAIRLIHAQLSEFELALLLYYIHTPLGSQTLRSLAERSGLFWNLPDNPLVRCMRTIGSGAFMPPAQALSMAFGPPP